MSTESNGQHQPESRLDRIEAALDLFIQDHEEFRLEHKRLLTAQVVMQDSMLQLGKKMSSLSEKVEEIGDKLNALIDWSDRTQRENEIRFRRLEEKH